MSHCVLLCLIKYINLLPHQKFCEFRTLNVCMLFCVYRIIECPKLTEKLFNGFGLQQKPNDRFKSCNISYVCAVSFRNIHNFLYFIFFLSFFVLFLFWVLCVCFLVFVGISHCCSVDVMYVWIFYFFWLGRRIPFSFLIS